jgi:hypothetical protein
MFQLGKTIVSEDISKDFVCNLTACKGLLCYGDAGAPLSLEKQKF